MNNIIIELAVCSVRTAQVQRIFSLCAAYNIKQYALGKWNEKELLMLK